MSARPKPVRPHPGGGFSFLPEPLGWVCPLCKRDAIGIVRPLATLQELNAHVPQLGRNVVVLCYRCRGVGVVGKSGYPEIPSAFTLFQVFMSPVGEEIDSAWFLKAPVLNGAAGEGGDR